MFKKAMLVMAALVGLTVSSVSAVSYDSKLTLGVESGGVKVSVSDVITPYTGFNLSLDVKKSPKVTLGEVSFHPVAVFAEQFCVGPVSPVVGRYVAGCVSIGGVATSYVGKLGVFTGTASGDGCIQVRMVAAADAVNNTYTVNPDPIGMQSNELTGSPLYVLVGRGTYWDCLFVK